MKNLTLAQLKEWKPCNGKDWIGRMQKMGQEVEWPVVVKTLTKEREFSALDWLIQKRLEKLSKRQACLFAYYCAKRSLKYAKKKDLEVLKKAISFAKEYAETGKVDSGAAWAASEVASEVARAASEAARAASKAVWVARVAGEAAWEASEAAGAVWAANKVAWVARAAWAASEAARAAGAAGAVWAASEAASEAARAASEAARAAKAASEATEYNWQFTQLLEIEETFIYA